MSNEFTNPLAEILAPSTNLPADIAFFATHGFRLDQIFPADDPVIARLSGHGLHLRIDRNAVCVPPTIRLALNSAPDGKRHQLQAPNGTTIVFDEQIEIQLTHANYPFEISRFADAPDQVTGRAGMLYRDLVPSRFGGKMIASHISIPVGGPVNDMVHFHEIEFQLIYCYQGWVRVVYEDQGEPMTLMPGDCVTQPPGIRHRVLESSDHLEVIEIGVPAMHMTNIDHELELPTKSLLPEKIFGGQTFCHHVASDVPWLPDHELENRTGFEARETGVALSSRGIASVKALRPIEAVNSDKAGLVSTNWCEQQGELAFYFVITGDLKLLTRDRVEHANANQLVRRDSITLPRGQQYRFSECSSDLVLLEVLLKSTTNAA